MKTFLFLLLAVGMLGCAKKDNSVLIDCSQADRRCPPHAFCKCDPSKPGESSGLVIQDDPYMCIQAVDAHGKVFQLTRSEWNFIMNNARPITDAPVAKSQISSKIKIVPGEDIASGGDETAPVSCYSDKDATYRVLEGKTCPTGYHLIFNPADRTGKLMMPRPSIAPNPPAHAKHQTLPKTKKPVLQLPDTPSPAHILRNRIDAWPGGNIFGERTGADQGKNSISFSPQDHYEIAIPCQPYGEHDMRCGDKIIPLPHADCVNGMELRDGTCQKPSGDFKTTHNPMPEPFVVKAVVTGSHLGCEAIPFAACIEHQVPYYACTDKRRVLQTRENGEKICVLYPEAK